MSELIFIGTGILLFLVMVSYVVRVILWRRPVKGGISQPLPELDEVLVRSEYFRHLSLQLQKKLDEVGEISRDLQRASEDWQQRYSVFESKVADLSDKEKELQAQVDSLGQIPLPAMEYFKAQLHKEGESAARRDYLLFCAGIVASLLVSLAIIALSKVFNL